MGVYGPWLNDAVTTWLSGKSIKAMLMTDAYVFSPDAHYRSDVSSAEAAGAGYLAGGVSVTGVSVAYDPATDAVRLTCDPVDFGTVTIAQVGAVAFYSNTGSAGTDVLISVDVFTPVEVDGTDLVYVPDAGGFALGTVS